ncbi:MAG: ABC transporter substrate-binding protein, partial [Pygmaiobacter massiliensis]
MTKKKVIAFALALSLTASMFAACGKAAPSSSASSAAQQSSSQAAGSWSYTDALGRQVKIDTMPQRVVSLYGSFAECWMLAGGK